MAIVDHPSPEGKGLSTAVCYVKFHPASKKSQSVLSAIFH